MQRGQRLVLFRGGRAHLSGRLPPPSQVAISSCPAFRMGFRTATPSQGAAPLNVTQAWPCAPRLTGCRRHQRDLQNLCKGTKPHVHGHADKRLRKTTPEGTVWSLGTQRKPERSDSVRVSPRAEQRPPPQGLATGLQLRALAPQPPPTAHTLQTSARASAPGSNVRALVPGPSLPVPCLMPHRSVRR